MANKHLEGVRSCENSQESSKCMKLQHEVFFEKQQNAMKQLMAGLLAQPDKKPQQRQVLAQVKESSSEIETSRCLMDKTDQNENNSPNAGLAPKPKRDVNLKIEELSNDSFHNQNQLRTRESRWNQDAAKSVYSTNSVIPEENFQSLQGLMSEKERANQEIEKIKRNKSLTPTDKQRAIKSVKSLTRTIDDLIFREKDKISEHYESQMLS